MHHLHRRRRTGASLSLFDYLMYGVGLVQPLALLPQVYAVYVEGQKQGISLTTWSLLTLFNALWAVYGYKHGTIPIMIANLFLMVLDIAIVFGVLFY